MRYCIYQRDDLVWLLRHTRAFRGGHIVDVHVSRRHIFDENFRTEVLAGTTVTLLIRYAVSDVTAGRDLRIQRVARLRCTGVTDFSFFEQEGANSGNIDAFQAEWRQGSFRFWFDPYGEVYVVCEAADVEEVCAPDRLANREIINEWVFQAREGRLPTAEWLLGRLDEAGLPCVWRPDTSEPSSSSGFEWSGALSHDPSTDDLGRGAVWVQAYGPLAGAAFGLIVRTRDRDPDRSGLFRAVTEIITRQFPGVGIGAEAIAPRR